MPSALQLNKIFMNKLAIRNHIKAEGASGAAYALSDLGDTVNNLTSMKHYAFLQNPERGGDWERAWAQRYYNSVGNIKRLASDGKGTLVLYGGVGFAQNAERYQLPGGLGVTFRKGQVPLDAQPIAHFDFTEDTTIQQLLAWVTERIDGMPDPRPQRAQSSSSSAK